MFSWTESANRTLQPLPPRQWPRVSPRHLCVICGKGDWCSYAQDGSEACCMRIAEGAYRHADLGHGQAHYHRLNGQRRPEPVNYGPPLPRVSTFELNFTAVLERWSQSTAETDLDELAIDLGVSWNSLIRLGFVRSVRHAAWGIPMYDERRRIIGIRLRSQQPVAGKHQKYSLNGSRPGLFLPTGIDSRSTLLICEGPTDTAAAVTMGFCAIGRPSCTGGVSLISAMLRAGRSRHVVIVADIDARGEGLFGANRLGDAIVGLCESVRVITCEPYKDLREWLRAGGNAIGVNHRIDNTEPRIRDGLDQSGKSHAQEG